MIGSDNQPAIDADHKILALPSGMVLPTERLASLCKKWGIIKLEIFGSALTVDFTQASDVDLLATFTDEANLGLDYFTAALDFQIALSRKVDLVSRQSLMRSQNRYRARRILESAIPVYEHS